MLKKFLLWFMETKLYDFIILQIAPYIRLSMYYTSFRGFKYHEGYPLLRPGLIIGSIDYKKLTGIIIPKVTGGILCHSAYCFGKRDQKNYDPLSLTYWKEGQEVAEMTHTNFTRSDFYDICREADRVILFECLDWDQDYVEQMNQAILNEKDALYDTRFNMGGKFLACSELIYEADRKANGGQSPRLQCDLTDLMGLGREYISPDGLLCAKNIRVVWDSAHIFSGMTGPEIEKIIFKEQSK